jgi:hypothetical protein
MIVVEVEREASVPLGVCNKKEHKAFLDCCAHGRRINRSFHEMGVVYESREAPSKPVKRGRVGGSVGFEELAAKKGKKGVVAVVENSSGQIALGKPSRKPTAKLVAGQVEVQKKKVADPSKDSFEIADCDMGSPAFMKALRATERSVPWGVGSRGWPIEIDIEQFGSLHAGPDSISAVIIDLHQKSSEPTRMNLADDESDEDSLKALPKVMMLFEVASKEAESVALEKVQVSPKTRASPMRSSGFGGDHEAPLVEEKLPEHVHGSFSKLGKILTTRRLPFQGPDIGPYLRYALEVDVVKLMTELGGIISEGSSNEMSSWAGSSTKPEGLPKEFESFNVGGILL